jgi:hypothetical protein
MGCAPCLPGHPHRYVHHSIVRSNLCRGGAPVKIKTVRGARRRSGSRRA